MILFNKFFTVGFLVTLFLFTNLTIHAEVLITPKNTSDQDALIFSAKKGEEVVKEITLKNISNEDANVVIDIHDLIQLDGGAVTTQRLEKDPKGLAKYTSLDVKNISLPALKSIDIPLKITIPEEVISGEYGLGFTLSQVQKSDEKSPIKNVISRGLKLYIFVEGGEKTLGASIEKIRVNENNSIEFEAQNTGSIFSKIVGTYSLYSVNGEQRIGSFQRDILSSTAKQFLISLPKDFVDPGELKVTYSIDPLTQNGEGVSKKVSTNSSLQYKGNQDKNSQKSNILQSTCLQIIGGILSLVALGFVLRKEIVLVFSTKND
jgi:hypothetical protein